MIKLHMIFRFDNKLLKKMIPLIIQIVPKKTTISVLTFLQFFIENGILYLSATNMESLLIIRLCNNINLPNISFLVKAQILQDILKNISEDYLEIEITHKNIKIQGIYTLFKCEEPFPNRDLSEFVFFQKINIDQLKSLFTAIDLNLRDDGTLKIDFEKYLIMYDRRRLSLTSLIETKINMNNTNESNIKNELYLDPQVMRTIFKIFNKTEKNINSKFTNEKEILNNNITKNQIILKVYKNELLFCQKSDDEINNENIKENSFIEGNINFIIKQKSATQIQYEHLLNFQKECFHLSVNTKELIKALKTTLILSSVLTRCIKCIISGEKFTIESFDPSSGNSSITINCQSNNDITFNLNGDYLLEALHDHSEQTQTEKNEIKGETNIYYTNSFKPIFILNNYIDKNLDFNTTHIIMPIRIN